jgi:inosine-uridine nucleoside N-ribohydrolase
VIPVLIDCDPGQDDALALLLALASPELDVVGVSAVAGNQTLDKTTTNALRVLELAGRTDIPVAAGADGPLAVELVVAADAHGETGLDGVDLPPPSLEPVPEHAADFLAAKIVASETPVTLVALGPLTNVALLLALRPEARPDRIVLMGGAIAEGNITPAAEFNIWVDPEAARRVFECGIELTMVGLDVTHRALLTPQRADELRASGRAGKLVAELFDFYHRFHRETYGLPGSPVHDALALASVFRPDLLTTRHLHVAVDCESQLCRGRTVVDLWQRTGNEPNAHVAVDVDGDAFVQLLVERITSLG